jgi:hypothetical protein
MVPKGLGNWETGVKEGYKGWKTKSRFLGKEESLRRVQSRSKGLRAGALAERSEQLSGGAFELAQGRKGNRALALLLARRCFRSRWTAMWPCVVAAG